MKYLPRSLTPKILLALMAIGAGLAAFATIATEVREGDTNGFDHYVIQKLAFTQQNPELKQIVRDITGVGGTTMLSLFTVLAIVFLVLAQKCRTALFVALSIGSGTVLMTLLKGLFNRPRPDVLPHGDYVSLASFPSGHSMMSAMVYLTLGSLIAGVVPTRRLGAYVMAVALLMTGAVGISRICLGVHWPTDVLAGWALGAAWALLWWSVAQWRQEYQRFQ